MHKTAVIFWSGTGHTEAMANAVLEGARSVQPDAALFSVADITAAEAADYDVLFLGCPAMGAEELEDSEFEPFFADLEASLSGKTVGLFGSYGWGDGEWMQTWAERVSAAGAHLISEEGVIANEDPDEDALDACRTLGKAVATL